MCLGRNLNEGEQRAAKFDQRGETASYFMKTDIMISTDQSKSGIFLLRLTQLTIVWYYVSCNIMLGLNRLSQRASIQRVLSDSLAYLSGFA